MNASTGRRLLLACAAALSLVACDPNDPVTPAPKCEETTCSGHGSCSVTGSTLTCACDSGYASDRCAVCADGFQDRDGDGLCAAACLAATCSGHGACDDRSGTAVCKCAAGYTGASCAECAAGYQDKDNDGTCSAECATSGLACGVHGTCSDASGTALCVCQATYAGVRCENCSAGFQDNDQNGSCTDDCATAALSCGSYGDCSDTSGTARCDCDTGYQGAACTSCAAGYELAAGVCVVSLNTGETCLSPIVLNGAGAVTGTTVGARDNANGTCGDQSPSGARPDLVYTFTAQARTRYQFLMEGYDTLLHLRSTCATASTELACNDDIQGQAAGMTGFVNAGSSYFLFADSYGAGGSYTLTYSLRTDPCAGDPCPGTPECVAQGDWGGYECVCPANTVPYNGSCIANPCDPNPCTTANKGVCTQQLPSYTCSCNSGYIADGTGCKTDPNANEWTFMVYLNGDNNLDDYGDADIAEMQTAGSNSYVNIIVMHDSSGSNDTKMLRILPGRSEALPNLLGKTEHDMGKWETLRDFGKWAIQTYPARHYALVMWDHGDGWKAKAPVLQALKGFSNDDNGSYEGISISGGGYASALAAIQQTAGGKLDLVGFDACLMGMYEVAKATAPYANYLVASEETEPADGWAYGAFLPGLVNNYTMTAATLGTSIVDAYYNAASDNATLALVNLATIPALDTSITGFANALMANRAIYSSISSARNATQAFYTTEHRDLKDFAKRVAAISSAPLTLVTAANALSTQLGQTIVYNRAQRGDYAYANGMAIYLPATTDYFDTDYTGVGATWSTATTWDNFLQDFAK